MSTLVYIKLTFLICSFIGFGFGSTIVKTHNKIDSTFSQNPSHFFSSLEKCVVRFVGDFSSSYDLDNLNKYLHHYKIRKSVLVIESIELPKFKKGNHNRFQLFKTHLISAAKYQVCFSQIFLESDTPGWDYQIPSGLIFHMLGSGEFPHYTIFINKLNVEQINSGKIRQIPKIQLYQELSWRHIPTKFFHIGTGNDSCVSLICMHCKFYNNQLILRPLQSFDLVMDYSLTDLSKVWEKFHTNSIGAKFIIPDVYMDQLNSIIPKSLRTCYPHGLAYPPVHCTLLEISSHFNFTLAVPSRVPDVGTIYNGWEHDNSYLSVIGHPGISYAFKFAVIVDLSELSLDNMVGLYKGMDNWTWLFTFITLGLSTIILALTFKNEMNTFQIFVSLVGFLGSQSMKIPKFSKAKYSILLTTWMLVTVVLSNGFSSVLFSAMTKPMIPAPVVPRTFEELLEQEYVLVTHSKVWHKYKHYDYGSGDHLATRIATLEYLMLELMEWLGRHEEQHVDLITNSKAINQSLICLDMDQLFKIFFHSDVNRMEAITSGGIIKNVSIPSRFAIVETTGDNFYDMVISLAKLSPNKLVPVEGQLPFQWIDFGAWLMTPTYLVHVLPSLFGKLTQAGIIMAWRKHYSNSQLSTLVLADAAEMQNKYNNKSLINLHELRRNEWKNDNGLPFKLLKQIFLLKLVALLSSIIVLIYEIARQKFETRKQFKRNLVERLTLLEYK